MIYALVILNVIDNGKKYNHRRVFEITHYKYLEGLAAMAEKELFDGDNRDHFISSPVHVYECSTSVIAKSLFDALNKPRA